MNEIGNFVKSTFSNILSKKAGNILDELGISLENDDGSMRDLMDVYKEVARVYVTLDQADKNRVTLGLAGKYHISRMQTLLDDLGKADSMYDQMYETSQKSANSAMSENQLYMQSLEARMNLARVEVEKLALAIGEAFMTEGMIQALQLFRMFMESVTALVKNVGFLAPALLASVTALALVSNRFSGVIGKLTAYIGSMGKAKKATEANSLATATLNRNAKHTISTTAQNTKQINQNTTSTNANTQAKQKASKASKLLSLGFGALGIGAIAVGFGIEKLLGWMGKARQEQEDYDNKIKEQIATYEQGRDSILDLAESYEELSQLNESGNLDPNTEKYAKYLEVQNELAGLLPDLKQGEDGLGNSVLKGNSYVQARIEMLEKQLEAQKALNDEEAKEKQEEEIKVAKDNAKDSDKDINKKLKKAGNDLIHLKNLEKNYAELEFFKEIDGKTVQVDLLTQLGISNWGEDLKDAEQLIGAINTVQGMLNDKEKIKFSDGAITTLETVLGRLQSKYDDVDESTKQLAQSNSVLRVSYADTLKKAIDETDIFSDVAKENFEKVAFSTLNLANSEDEFESLTDAFSNMASKTGKDKAQIQSEFELLTTATTQMKESGITDVDELESKYSETFTKIRDRILMLSGLDKKTPEYKNLKASLDAVTTDVFNFEVEVLKESEALSISTEEARANLASKVDLSDVTNELSSELQEEVKSLQELSSYYEKLTGVSSKQIEETDELIFMYETLSEKTNRTARENEILEESMQLLSALYPELVQNGKVRVENIQAENDMMKALQEAYQASKDGILSAEEETTMEQAQNIMVRMGNLKQEISVIQSVIDAYNETKQVSRDNLKELGKMGFEVEWEGQNVPSPDQVVDQINEFYKGKSTELDGYTKQIEEATSKINTSVKNATEREKEREKSQKDSSETQSELQKITDKYATTLEKLDTQLAQVQAKQRKYPTYSKAYRNALQEEINLLNQQIDLNNQRSKDLNGVPATISSGGGGGGSLSGWNNTITSGYGAKESFRKSAHTGIDIDGYMGERLDSNVSGKVQKTGYDNISGNYVAIIDENGYRHLYAHLNDIAVATGQMVKMGDKIGSIGNTGNVVSTTGDGSHLHYEIKLNGKQIDPTQFVNTAKGISVNVATTAGRVANSGGGTKDTIWNYFKGKGLDNNAVAGIMGNIQQESDFNAKAVNSKSGASGIFQWLGSRKKELMAYADNLGKSWTDLKVQLDFAWKEMNSTEKNSLTSLKKNMSATQHASEFERLFERSGGSHVGKRQTYAQNILGLYQGSSTTTVSTGGTSQIANGEHEQAIQSIEQLKRENISLSEQAQQKYYEIIKSYQAEFQRNYQMEADSQQRNEAVKQGNDKTNEKYEEAVNKQLASEKKKHEYLKAEYDYIQKRLNAGSLTQIQEDELLDRRYELYGLMIESQNAERAYYSEVIEVNLTRFDESMQKHADILGWENTKIQEVDKSSSRYAKTLEIMAKAQSSQLEIAKEEQKFILKQLSSGKLTTEMYDTLQEKAKELKNELITLQQELQKTNYEMIMTNLALSDEGIDDIDFSLDRSKNYESLYDEGSADQKREILFQLDELDKKLKEVEQRGKNLQLDMRGKVLGHSELQELEELIEDNALALLDVQSEILETQKRLKDFDKIIDEQIEDKRGDVIDDILDTLKDSYKELADIEEKRLDDLIDAENERHDKAMENLSDELDQYNKIIDAKRRELDDEDRDRTHNNSINELTSEKQELQSRLNLLSNVNTYEGKKEREDLQKQIAEIDKQIVEERYQYEKDLRHQQLDDELEAKTEHIEELQDIEDEQTKVTLEKLNKEKEYYQKYYDDLINDEREFERLRKEMLAGNFTEIETLFAKHAEKLKLSLPDLELSIQGMTERVGTQIRENVIYELQNLVKEIEKVEKEVEELNKLKDKATNKYGSSVEDKPQNNLNDENGKLREADLKVILAKFMNEQIAGKLNPTTDKDKIKNIKDRATALADEGRKEGSALSAGNHSLNDIFSSLSTDQVKQVGGYFQSNASESGLDTQEYLNYISEFGQTASEKTKLLPHGDKQVMLAKYINEHLIKMTDNKGLQQTLKATADNIASLGRKNGALIGANVNYDSQMKTLTQPQRAELGNYILDNSGVVYDGALRSKMEDYAERLKLSYTDEYTSMATGASLDTGGMTKAFGSSGGVDGKGGKMAILHEREIVLNPVDTARILNVASIMENIMRNISGVVNLPKIPSISQPNNTTTSEKIDINIHIAKMSGNQSDIDNLAKQIQNRLLREKGKR